MNPWFTMANNATLAIWDAQRDMALSFLQLAAGGTSRVSENVVPESARNVEAASLGAKSPRAIGEQSSRIAKKRVKTHRRTRNKR